jgi:Uma2 family endonuclease
MGARVSAPAAAEQVPVIPRRMTWEEYLVWDCDGLRAEWVDGELLLMPPNSATHQRVLQFLLRLVAGYVEPRRLGHVTMAPFVMYLPTRPSGRQPDLLFLAAEHACRLLETHLHGPADVVVEVTAPESDARDRATKFLEYEVAGVPEYWLVDPLRSDAWFFRLGTDAHYHRVSVAGDGIYRSRSLTGFAFRVDWLWQRPLPPVGEALRQVEAWAVGS